jgi:hypothetical protein
MFNTIHAIAATIQNFVNRTEYVFKIFVWAVEALKQISAILGSFPKPPAAADSSNGDAKSGDGNKGAGDAKPGNGESNGGQSLPGTLGELAGSVKDGKPGMVIELVQDGKQPVGDAAVSGEKS